MASSLEIYFPATVPPVQKAVSAEIKNFQPFLKSDMDGWQPDRNADSFLDIIYYILNQIPSRARNGRIHSLCFPSEEKIRRIFANAKSFAVVSGDETAEDFVG